MKALILDGSPEGDGLTPVAVAGMASALVARAAAVDRVVLRDRDVAPCAGCFGCWTKTPGECVVRDDARDILRAYVRSDAVVYATPVTFGGYSSDLKKFLDRLIPVLDPRFAVVGGEVHHRLRYRRYPTMIGLGTLPAPDPEAEGLFARLVSRNGLNVHQAAGSAVLVGVADPGAARRLVEPLLDRVQARS
ncbi:MAG: flavodoxin family protein [Gemmatimonadota bacterium]